MNEDCLLMIGYMEQDFVPEREWKKLPTLPFCTIDFTGCENNG